jgi:hypothetical protein
MQQEQKQETSTTDARLRRRARLVKQKHKEIQQTERNRRAQLSGAPKCVATLKAINKYKKLVFYTQDDKTQDILMSIDESFDELNTPKKPLWVNHDETGIWFKMSVPKFMYDNLWNYENFVNKDVNVIFHAKSYQSEKFGTGYYLTLAADLKLVETEL